MSLTIYTLYTSISLILESYPLTTYSLVCVCVCVYVCMFVCVYIHYYMHVASKIERIFVALI